MFRRPVRRTTGNLEPIHSNSGWQRSPHAAIFTLRDENGNERMTRKNQRIDFDPKTTATHPTHDAVFRVSSEICIMGVAAT